MARGSAPSRAWQPRLRERPPRWCRQRVGASAETNRPLGRNQTGARRLNDRTRGDGAAPRPRKGSMFLVTRNPLLYLIGLGVSLAVTALIYFAIVKPQLDTANQTTRDAIRQAQPALNRGGAELN